MNDDFETALDLLIKWNEENRKRMEMKRHLNPVSYYKEMCTVKVNAGRGIGHTTYIKNKAHPKKDLIIAPTNYAFREPNTLISIGTYNFYLANQFMFHSQGIEFKFERIYVDQAEKVFLQYIDLFNFYSYIAARIRTTKDPLFIFLG